MSPENEAQLEPLLTLKDVAKYLRVSPATATKLAREGEIVGMKIGKQWRFHRSALFPQTTPQNPKP